MVFRGLKKVALLLPLLHHGSAFTGRMTISNTARSSMVSTVSSTRQGYWEQTRSVPGRFLQRIREEPWRGALEPCLDHPLTEIMVEGEVPKALQGTLFRNGKRYRLLSRAFSSPRMCDRS